jgi:hypothetical protein
VPNITPLAMPHDAVNSSDLRTGTSDPLPARRRSVQGPATSPRFLRALPRPLQPQVRSNALTCANEQTALLDVSLDAELSEIAAGRGPRGSLTWGFAGWQVLGSNQRRLSRRFYIPEGAGRGQGAVCPVFCCFRVGFGHAGGRPGAEGCSGREFALGRRPSSRVLAGVRVRYEVVGAPRVVSGPGQALGCVHPFGGARGWMPRGHGAGSRAGSGINQTGGRPPGGGGQ